MRKILTFTVGTLFVLAATTSLAAQLGVERRIDRRLDRRADAGNPSAAARLDARASNPDAWRMRYYNNQWWYYTPQSQWMYYDNNNWAAYDANTYLPPRQSYIYGNYNYGPAVRGRYYTGYRGFWGPPANAPTANFGANVGVNAGPAGNGPASARTGAAVNGTFGTQPGAVNAAGGTVIQPNAPAPANQPAPGGQTAPAPQQPQGQGGQPAANPAPAAGNQQNPDANQQTPAPASSGQNRSR